MSMLCAALFLVLGPPTGDHLVHVDWSSAAGGGSAIADVRRNYVTAINARDARAEVFYAPDAVAALSSGSIVNGAPALAERLRSALDTEPHGVTITLTPQRFVMDGATGSETGTFVETISEGIASHTVDGVYVTIYARGSDGQWRIAMEVRSTGSRPSLTSW